VGADLSKVAKAPINLSLENDYKNTIEKSYQTIPDKDVACYMILKSITCLGSRKDDGATALASKLIDNMSTQHICGSQVLKLRSKIKLH
jgi:hypothetical protein